MKNFMKNILHKIFSINYPWLKKRLQDKIKAINHFSVETWLHGTNSRLNGNLPFLAHTKEFHTTVTGPLIRRYAITISKHRVVNVNSPKEDAWIIKKPRSGNYHIMGRVLEEQAWDKFDRLEKRFIKIHPFIKAVSFTLYIYTFRHRRVILQNCLVSALLLSQLNIFGGNKKSNVVSWK